MSQPAVRNRDDEPHDRKITKKAKVRMEQLSGFVQRLAAMEDYLRELEERIQVPQEQAPDDGS